MSAHTVFFCCTLLSIFTTNAMHETSKCAICNQSGTQTMWPGSCYLYVHLACFDAIADAEPFITEKLAFFNKDGRTKMCALLVRYIQKKLTDEGQQTTQEYVEKNGLPALKSLVESVYHAALLGYLQENARQFEYSIPD